MPTLPRQFCWTRFGTEASQTIDRIVARKEKERASNGGVFFWGIGNAVGPSLRELVDREDSPEVIFSPIKGRPRQIDVMPTAVVAWTMAHGLTGESYGLTPTSLITSRYDPDNPKQHHYALVCARDEPLVLCESETVHADDLRNILTGNKIGSSQVTAVVGRDEVQTFKNAYAVSLRANLVYPYLLTLSAPIILPTEIVMSLGEADYAEVVKQHWQKREQDLSQFSLALSR